MFVGMLHSAPECMVIDRIVGAGVVRAPDARVRGARTVKDFQ